MPGSSPADTEHVLARRLIFVALVPYVLWLPFAYRYHLVDGVNLGDARVQRLPLVGGHLHDWNWLLGRAGLLEHCTLIAALLHGFASALALAMLAIAAHAVMPRRTPSAAAPAYAAR